MTHTLDVLRHPATNHRLSYAPVLLSWAAHFIPALSNTPGLYLADEPLSEPIVDMFFDLCATDERGLRDLHSETVLCLPKGSAKSQIGSILVVAHACGGPVRPAGIAKGGERFEFGVKSNGDPAWVYEYQPGDVMAEPERAAECYVVANSVDQIKRTMFGQIFNWLGGTGEDVASERLVDALEIRPGDHIMRSAYRNPDGRGKIEVIAPRKGEDKVDGLRPTLVIFDESHLMTGSINETAKVLLNGLVKMQGRAFHSTTAHGIGEESLLERTLRLADDIKAGRARSKALLVHHAKPSADNPLADEDDIRAALTQSYAAAPWVDIEGRLEAFYDPRQSPEEAKRLFLGIPTTPDTRWLDAQTIADITCIEPVQLQPKQAVALGFDASMGRANTHGPKVLADWTALVAATIPDDPEKPIVLVPVHVWQPNGYDWSLDYTEVGHVVTDAFKRFRVLAGAFDPPYIEAQLAQWERDYGRSLVAKQPTRNKPLTFHTNQSGNMAKLIADFEIALLEGRVKIDDHADMVAHFRAATRRASGGSGYTLAKPDRNGPDKIDLVIASALAWQAAMMAISAGGANRKNSHRKARSFLL